MVRSVVRVWDLAVVSALVVTLSSALSGQSRSLNTETLIRESDVIVSGTVGALRAEWNADRTRIRTVVTIRVGETMKGSVGNGELSVVIPGGEIGDTGEWYSHSPRFRADEEVVVFARRDAEGIMRVTGGEHGKFVVADEAKSGSKVIPNVGTLRDFTAQVKKKVAAESSTPADQ